MNVLYLMILRIENETMSKQFHNTVSATIFIHSFSDPHASFIYLHNGFSNFFFLFRSVVLLLSPFFCNQHSKYIPIFSVYFANFVCVHKKYILFQSDSVQKKNKR